MANHGRKTPVAILKQSDGILVLLPYEIEFKKKPQPLFIALPMDFIGIPPLQFFSINRFSLDILQLFYI